MRQNWFLACLVVSATIPGPDQLQAAQQPAAPTTPPAVSPAVPPAPTTPLVINPPVPPSPPPPVAVAPTAINPAQPVLPAPSNHHLLGCWARHRRTHCCLPAEVGCSSLASEMGFLFGSCRAFFGEPCLKGPPAPLLHPFPVKAPPLVCEMPAAGLTPAAGGPPNAGCGCR
jgi:hypothetical protein